MPLIEEQKNWHICSWENLPLVLFVDEAKKEMDEEREEKTITSSHDHLAHKKPLFIPFFIFYVQSDNVSTRCALIAH